MDYAMVLKGSVIDVFKNVNDKPEYPSKHFEDEILAVRCDGVNVAVNMLYSNGAFFYADEPIVPEQVYTPTKGELLIMETQATMYEELQENKLSQMKANADIYEAILSNGGTI